MSLQPLDQQYLDNIFDRLATLEIQLDDDPLAYGPKRLNAKTALCRKMLTECERMFLDVSQKTAAFRRAHRAAELTLSLLTKNLLANDPETRAGRAVSEREAIAAGKLKAEVQAVADAQNGIAELEQVMDVIKAKRADLRDIQGRLRDQVRLCQEEIGLGSKWGSKSPRAAPLQPGQGVATAKDVEHMDSLMAAVADAETHLQAEVDATDSDQEVLDSLLANADEAEDDALPPVVVRTTTAPRPPPRPIPGTELVAEFGFVPHCEVCGEMQSKTPHGMACPNGHGGSESVPPPSDPLTEDGSSVGTLLPGTTDTEEVAAFLAVPTDQVVTRKSRRQLEDEDLMDLNAILEKFE